MFNFKHEIELNNNEIICLFGEDFYNDKRVFFKSHQTKLEELCTRVCEAGFPIKITDLHYNKVLQIASKFSFDIWLKTNHQYQCNCNKTIEK